MTAVPRKLKLVTFAMTIVLLVGCGGGSGGGSHERHTVGAAKANRSLAAGEPTHDTDDFVATDEPWASEPSPRPDLAPMATVLSWIAPVSRVDGSVFSLSQLKGYVLSIGDESRQYDHTIELGALTEEYSLHRLELGHYYVAIQARDMDDRLSPYSDELRVAVN